MNAVIRSELCKYKCWQGLGEFSPGLFLSLPLKSFRRFQQEKNSDPGGHQHNGCWRFRSNYQGLWMTFWNLFSLSGNTIPWPALGVLSSPCPTPAPTLGQPMRSLSLREGVQKPVLPTWRSISLEQEASFHLGRPTALGYTEVRSASLAGTTEVFRTPRWRLRKSLSSLTQVFWLGNANPDH